MSWGPGLGQTRDLPTAGGAGSRARRRGKLVQGGIEGGVTFGPHVVNRLGWRIYVGLVKLPERSASSDDSVESSWNQKLGSIFDAEVLITGSSTSLGLRCGLVGVVGGVALVVLSSHCCFFFLLSLFRFGRWARLLGFLLFFLLLVVLLSCCSCVSKPFAELAFRWGNVGCSAGG